MLCKVPGAKSSRGFPCDRNATRLRRVFELSVTSAGRDDVPTVVVKLAEDLSDLHSSRIQDRPGRYNTGACSTTYVGRNRRPRKRPVQPRAPLGVRVDGLLAITSRLRASTAEYQAALTPAIGREKRFRKN